MAKGKLVQLRVDLEDWERWRKEAKRRGMSLSALVRWAMDRPLRYGCVEPIELPAEAAEALDMCAEVKAEVVRALAGKTVASAEEPVAESEEAVEGAEEPSPDGFKEPAYEDEPDPE